MGTEDGRLDGKSPFVGQSFIAVLRKPEHV